LTVDLHNLVDYNGNVDKNVENSRQKGELSTWNIPEPMDEINAILVELQCEDDIIYRFFDYVRQASLLEPAKPDLVLL
jgi:hypothetical protein